VALDFFDRFPILETEHLRLRGLIDDDAPAVCEVFQDDEVTRYYDVETMTGVAAAAELISRMRKRYVDRAGIRWALVDKLDAKLVGTIGFNTITPSGNRGAIGYELARRAWGRGLATEAVQAVVRFGHDKVELNRIEATVMLGNEASARVLQKAGFKEEGVLRAFGHWKGHYHDLRMFSVLRSA
jgi:ribosomal-protein-alanine N-acetyltransferase